MGFDPVASLEYDCTRVSDPHYVLFSHYSSSLSSGNLSLVSGFQGIRNFHSRGFSSCCFVRKLMVMNGHMYFTGAV